MFLKMPKNAFGIMKFSDTPHFQFIWNFFAAAGIDIKTRFNLPDNGILYFALTVFI